MTDCKARQCWCKDMAQSEKDQVRESLRIMQERIAAIEASPKIQLSYHDSVFDRIDNLESHMGDVHPSFCRVGENDPNHDPDPILISQSGIDDMIERLEELERWPSFTKNLEKRIERLERVSGKEVLEALTGFERRIDMLDNAFRELLHSCNLKGPYRCPLCEGNGSVMINKDTADGPRQHFLENFACSSCKGKGIVWKP